MVGPVRTAVLTLTTALVARVTMVALALTTSRPISANVRLVKQVCGVTWMMHASVIHVIRALFVIRHRLMVPINVSVIRAGLALTAILILMNANQGRYLLASKVVLVSILRGRSGVIVQ